MTKWLLQVVKDLLTLYTLKGQESSGHEQPGTVDNVEETTTQIQLNSHSITSIADELSKLAKLRDQGVSLDSTGLMSVITMSTVVWLVFNCDQTYSPFNQSIY